MTEEGYFMVDKHDEETPQKKPDKARGEAFPAGVPEDADVGTGRAKACTATTSSWRPRYTVATTKPQLKPQGGAACRLLAHPVVPLNWETLSATATRRIPGKARRSRVVRPSPTRHLGPVCFGDIQRLPDSLALTAARSRQPQQRHLVGLEDLVLDHVPL